ncbi:B12-binding domain-containing radical SAM protein [Actinomadura roseirufa]|uniref:B12-binding domain-containing radical SAM protein n=1 Tax=Actinomadura roseirufa TaxID=2094049 RepID=UPI001040E3F9|nr:radical SAM protein [Actinomadura roseirufa]
MGDPKTIFLSYPPASSIWHLPMGIAFLASILERRGHRVVQHYGHIDGVEHVLRRQGGSQVDQALRIVRDPSASVLQRHDARTLFEDVSAAVPTSAEVFAVERNNVRYDSRTCKGRISELRTVLRLRDEHVFHDYFAEVELERIRAAAPDVVGISVSDERQLVAGCVLASLVREAMPGIRLLIGGNYWARTMTAYHDPEFVPLFDHWDAIVYAEGFEPMVALAEGADPGSVPGVVWRDGDTVRVNPRTTAPVDYETLPTPVFDRGIRQWSPDFVPPLYSMSNCPMRCRFCSIAAGSDTFLHKPRVMSERRVAEHIAALGTDRVDFVDEYLTVPRQLKIGRELARIGHRATWQCYLTAGDQLLNPDTCHRLAEAGCRAVQLGLESLDPDVLRQEAKPWNHPANYGRILRNLSEAGIQVHVFIIVGVPGEQINRSLRWLSFLEEYGEHILTIKSGRYRLTRQAPDEGLAGLGRLSGLHVTGTDDQLLNLNRDQFRYTTDGLSRKRVEAIRDLLEEACRRHWAYQVTSTIPWWINRGRYTLPQLRDAAEVLGAHRPPEPSISDGHLKRGLAKVGTALHEELALRVPLGTYEDARDVSARLRAEDELAPAAPAAGAS